MWKEIKSSNTLDQVSGWGFSCISLKCTGTVCCLKKYPKSLIPFCVTLMFKVLEVSELSLLTSGEQGGESCISCRILSSYCNGRGSCVDSQTCWLWAYYSLQAWRTWCDECCSLWHLWPASLGSVTVTFVRRFCHPRREGKNMIPCKTIFYYLSPLTCATQVIDSFRMRCMYVLLWLYVDQTAGWLNHV